MTSDPYDEVHYKGYPFAQTHPDRLFVVGALHGLDPAPPGDCRLLEIGCGDGVNAVAMAADLPGLHVTGIDRAARPLERGRAIARELGLRNFELRAADILAAPDLGEFDYVVSHGVYAWVPAEVRDGLLALAARSLAPGGLAFVSYNATPGGHVRRAMRDLIRFHARDAADPEQRVARAREISAWFQRWPDRSDPYGAAVERELRRIDRLSDHSLVHDDLGEVWEPCSLTEFTRHAGAHGLRHVADAELHELRSIRFPEGVEAALDGLAPDDLVAREQYGDLLSGRAFRQSVLCHAALAPSPRPVPAALARLHLSSTHRPDPLPGGAYASQVDAACAVLAERHPRSATLAELAATAGAEPDELAAPLLGAFRAGLVDLHARPPRHALEVPERPAATLFARIMARDGGDLVTLAHEPLSLEDLFRRKLVTLLDGLRDRAQLLDGMLAAVGRELVVEVEGEPVRDPEVLREPFAERLEEELDLLARAGIILAPEHVAAA